MNTKTHVITALIISVFIIFFLKFDEIYLLGIIIGVLLPDILEPPKSIFHRKFFHSKRMLKGIVLIMTITFILSYALKSLLWLFFILLGYEIHLLGDLMFHRLPR